MLKTAFRRTQQNYGLIYIYGWSQKQILTLSYLLNLLKSTLEMYISEILNVWEIVKQAIQVHHAGLNADAHTDDTLYTIK